LSLKRTNLATDYTDLHRLKPNDFLVKACRKGLIGRRSNLMNADKGKNSVFAIESKKHKPCHGFHGFSQNKPKVFFG
jgi:hypothetical protein